MPVPEPFSLTTGAVGLATACKACIDIFEYVYVGRRFGKDYATAQLRLAVLQLRLSRWGAAIHIDDDPQYRNPLPGGGDVQTAKDILGQIYVLLNDSSKTTRQFDTVGLEGKRSIADGNDESHDPNDTTVTTALTRRMRDMATKRQKGTNGLKLTKWAIHSRAALDRLIGDIKGLVDDLEVLFPAADARQRLAQDEVAGLSPREVQQLAAAAATGVDPALEKATAAADGHKYERIEIESGGGEGGRDLWGNYVANGFKATGFQGASHSYNGVKIKGGSGHVSLFGNKYGGEDPFSGK